MNENIAEIIVHVLVGIFLIGGFIGCLFVGGEHINDHVNDKYKKK